MPVERNGAVLGRDDDLARLDRQVAAGRFVTVVGLGGVGKTQLVHAWLAVNDRWPDQVVLDVGGVADAAELPAALGRAAGIVEDPEQPLLDQLAGRLGREGTIVVLDGVERLLEEVGALAADLLDRCPPLTVVVTSRAPTGAAGESMLRLEGLRSPFAERLFADAAATVPGFFLSPRDHETVTALCERLDGLPLAIEMAARRMSVLEPAYLLERLEGGLSPLVDSDREPRHRAMIDVLTLSTDLLPEAQRALLWRLSVFSGPFPAAAAAAVGDVQDLPAALEDLVATCLLQPQAGGRYRLPQMVRVHGRGMLEHLGQVEDARRRAVSWAIDRASGRAGVRADLEHDHDLLLGLLAGAADAGAAAEMTDLAVALSPFWEVRGHLTTGRRWLKAAVDATTAAPPAVRAPVCWAAGRLVLAAGDTDAAQVALEAALEAFAAADDAAGRAGVLGDLALVARHRSEHDEAERLLRRSVATAREVKDGALLVRSLTRLTDLLLLARGEAAPLSDEALAVAAELGDPRLEAEALVVAGDVHVAAQEHEWARRSYEAALDRSRQAGDGRLEGRALNALGRVAMAVDDLEGGRALHEEAVAVLLDVGDVRTAAASLADLAFVVWLQEDEVDARQLYLRSLELARRLGDRRLTAAALLGAANSGFTLGLALDEVRPQCEEAIAVLRDVQDARNLAWATYVAGEVASEQGDTAAARARAEESLGLFASGADHTNLRSLPLITLAGLAVRSGDDAEARRLLREALETARRVASPIPLLRIAATTAAVVAGDHPAVAAQLAGWAESVRARGLRQQRLRALVEVARHRAGELLEGGADELWEAGALLERDEAADLVAAVLDDQRTSSTR